MYKSEGLQNEENKTNDVSVIEYLYCEMVDLHIACSCSQIVDICNLWQGVAIRCCFFFIKGQKG